MTNTVQPMLLAHRGLSSLAPENTLIAFAKAQQLDFNWLEFDVALSKDNIPIVFHDDNLKRLSGKRGKISDLTFKELQQIDIGRKFHKSFHGTNIPSLKEVLLFMKKFDLFAVLEVKPSNGNDSPLVNRIVEIIKEVWPDGFEHFIFSSFSIPSLAVIRKLLPQQALGFALHKWRKDFHAYVEAFDCQTIHVNHKILTRSRVNQLKKTGKQVWTYTVNRLWRAKRLKLWGVDGFFSDCPQKLRAQL